MKTRTTVDDDLRRALDEEVGRRIGRRVVDVQRRPHPYRTSFPLEEVDVLLDDGRRLELVFKDLGLEGLERLARLAKGSERHDPRRELEAYRMLEGTELGAPTLYGSVSDTDHDRHWLFIERIPGVPLWQFGEQDVWQAAGSWLARLHRRFHGMTPESGSVLLVHDGARARAEMQRAVAIATGWARVLLQRLESRFDEAADWLDQVPRTLVHGDFHASNVMVDSAWSPPRIAPADWELAGVGPGLLDLASLTAGRWTDADRGAVVSVYASTAGRSLDSDFLADLDRCRLYNAITLLGVSPDWLPPSEHHHDWLSEAESAAERLGIV
jgi:aminoglycoside phosphotransferase